MNLTRVPRFYMPPARYSVLMAGVLEMPKPIAHHMRVLRLQAGDVVQLFNGVSTAWQGVVLELNSATVHVDLHAVVDENPALELPFAITVAQSLIEPSKMDWVVEKTVELGAIKLQAIAAARSVTRLDADRAAKRVAHWQAISVAASEQCGRYRVMHIATPVSLIEALKQSSNTTHLVLHPEGGTPLHIWCHTQIPQDVTLWIGPEGGWTMAELVQLEAAGAQRITFGARVLRTETAAAAISAALQVLWF
jgi:16S rRNA (uracil1498-N3)-methyltransferase